MSDTPLFDETGQHCLRPAQGPEEGVLLIRKLESATLKSCALVDVLKLINTLEIPIDKVIDSVGKARVVFDEED